LSPRTHAPIEVFAVQEISFIERPNVRDHLPVHHHAGAGNRLDLGWPFGERILGAEGNREVGKGGAGVISPSQKSAQGRTTASATYAGPRPALKGQD
jgi:hypothetical protein